MTTTLEQQTTARAALKAASKEAAKCKSEVQTLEESLSRATAMIEEAEVALQGFDGLDHETARWRANAIRKGEDPRALPAEITARIRARADATNELTQATETRELIDAELKAAKTRLNKLTTGLAPRAGAVLGEYAEIYAKELTALKNRAAELQLMLEGINSLQYIDPDAPYGQHFVSLASTPAIKAALAPCYRAENVADMAGLWKSLLETLIKNPDEPISNIQFVRAHEQLQTTA